MIRRQTEFNEVNLATAIFRLASQGAGCIFKRLARMGKRTKCMTTSPVSFAKFASGTWVSSLHGLWMLQFNIHR